MTIEQALEFVHSTRKLGSKLGLTNIKALVGLLGNPHKELKFIHVAGTNGKGSTCAYISNILKDSGYKTGLFTSPDIEKYSERFQINNENISDDDLISIISEVKEKVDIMISNNMNHPTEFEINTAMALLYFKQKNCDVVVWETGLGGRLDSTNVIEKPVACVITAIDFDHMHILGDTIEAIASEKAGIIKKECDVVLYGENDEKAVRVITDKAKEMNCDIHISDFDLIENKRSSLTLQKFDYKGYKDLGITLLGSHQFKNAALAVDLADVLRKTFPLINKDSIYSGLIKTRWPGRLEILMEKPVVICDGAHNLQGVRNLKISLDEIFPDRKVIFIMGIMKDKNYEEMAKVILEKAKAAIAVRIDYDRMLDVKTLSSVLQRYCNNVFSGDTIAEGMNIALSIADENDLICSFGSLYTIAEVKKYIREI